MPDEIPGRDAPPPLPQQNPAYVPATEREKMMMEMFLQHLLRMTLALAEKPADARPDLSE